MKPLNRLNLAERPRFNAPKDASMTLLNEVMHRPLDPGYATAAEQRRIRQAQGEPPVRVWVKGSSLILAVVLGFTTITAVLSLRSRADVADGARNLLREQIVERSDQMLALEQSISSLSADAQGLQNELLDSVTGSLTEEQQQDVVLNGVVPVHGPGITVTLSDGPNVDLERDNRVRDIDVRGVVSALWSSGAEAIAVNGKRLTPTSAIRNAGDAILVDLTGLSGPYAIQAIGNPKVLEVQFVKNPITADLLELESRYGIKTTVMRADELVLDAGASRTLMYATAQND